MRAVKLHHSPDKASVSAIIGSIGGSAPCVGATR
jgi:hypothetical protein